MFAFKQMVTDQKGGSKILAPLKEIIVATN